MTNLTISPKNESIAEPIVDFMLTAFDQYGVPFGYFVENERYLKTVDCDHQGLNNQYKIKHGALMNAGPLFATDEIDNFYWIAESPARDEPQIIQFYMSLALPDRKFWVKRKVGQILVV